MQEQLLFLFEHHYKGYKNRAPKKHLITYFSLKDNQEWMIRNEIQKLRDQGYRIAFSSDGKGGYWLTNQNLVDTDPVEYDKINAVVKELGSRIKHLQKLKQLFEPLVKNARPAEQLEFKVDK